MAVKTGSDHSRMMPSISVSRIVDWAEAGPAAAITRTAADAATHPRMEDATRVGRNMANSFDWRPRLIKSLT